MPSSSVFGRRSGADANRKELGARPTVHDALFVPACLVLILVAHSVLLTFCAEYSHNGTLSLMILALAVIPLAASNWSWTVPRLTGHLKPLIVSTGVFTLAICGLACFLVPHGLTALAASSPLAVPCPRSWPRCRRRDTPSNATPPPGDSGSASASIHRVNSRAYLDRPTGG